MPKSSIPTKKPVSNSGILGGAAPKVRAPKQTDAVKRALKEAYANHNYQAVKDGSQNHNS